MKRNRYVRIIALCITAIMMFSLTSCLGNSSKSLDGTYYHFEDGHTDKYSWVRLNGTSWRDSDDMYGTYELDGENITFYVSIDGVKEMYVEGTIANDKLTVSAAGISVEYYLEGKAPDANGNDNNGEENNGGNQNGEASPEEQLAAFEYEKEGDKYIITGIKDEDTTEIVVPDFVSEIEQGAFEKCTKVVSVTVPFLGAEPCSEDYHSDEFAYIFCEVPKRGGITSSFGASPDYYAPQTIEEIKVTGDVYLTSSAFAYSSAKNITFEGKVFEIGNCAFYGCSNLEKLTLPAGAERVGAKAFYDCTALTELYIPDGVLYVENSVVTGNDAVKVSLPASLKSLDSYDGCSFVYDTIEIEYRGTMAQWAQVTIASHTSCSHTHKVTCSDGVLEEGYLNYQNPNQ